jgi:hypothetical protein
MTFSFWDSLETELHGMCVKKNIRANQCGSGSDPLLFSLRICGFGIADYDTKEICRFAICRVILTNLRICDLLTGTPHIFADLLLRNELKNLRIFDLRNKKQNLRAHPPLMINLAGDPS